jgi:hypothetical protein
LSHPAASPLALSLIQDDRAVFCKHGLSQTRFIDRLVGDVAAHLFGRPA